MRLTAMFATIAIAAVLVACGDDPSDPLTAEAERQPLTSVTSYSYSTEAAELSAAVSLPIA
jgi:hypothetical protein